MSNNENYEKYRRGKPQITRPESGTGTPKQTKAGKPRSESGIETDKRPIKQSPIF